MRNEAAERLRKWTGAAFPGTPATRIARDLDEALTTERRLAKQDTVDEIRERAFDLTKPASTEPRRWAPNEMQLRAILNEVAGEDR